MGRYITASEAARRIGVTDKSVRKWIRQGKLDAHHVTPNQLAILETDVDSIIRERRLYQQSDNQADLLTRLLSLEQKVTEQEQRIASLETQLQASLRVPTQPERASTTQNIKVPAKGPEIASTEARNSIPDELPSGMLSVRDFAEKIGMDYTILDGYTRRGIRGEKLDVTEVPHPTRKGYTNKYFTPAQQEKALDMLKRHGKL